jgi:hypothetical protein
VRPSAMEAGDTPKPACGELDARRGVHGEVVRGWDVDTLRGDGARRRVGRAAAGVEVGWCGAGRRLLESLYAYSSMGRYTSQSSWWSFTQHRSIVSAMRYTRSV